MRDTDFIAKIRKFFTDTGAGSLFLFALLVGLVAAVKGVVPDEPRRRKLAAVVVAAVLAAAGLAAVAVWPREASATPGSVTFVHDDVTVDSINDSFVWDALYNRGSYPYSYNGFIVKGARYNDGSGPFPGYVAWYNSTSGNGGVVDAVATREGYTSEDHASTSLKIDADGYLWMATGGYGSDNTLKLFKSNASLDVNNWTDFATISTGAGTCEPRIVLNETMVSVFWRDGPNDNENTNIRRKTWYRSNGTLASEADIAKGGASFVSGTSGDTLTSSYPGTHYDPFGDTWYLSWSYKLGAGTSTISWGDFPYISVDGVGDTGNLSCFHAANGTAYSVLDDGNGLMEYDDLDIPIPLLPDEEIMTSACRPSVGVLPDGREYYVAPFKNETAGNNNALFTVHDGSSWSTPINIGDFYNIPAIRYVYDFYRTQNHAFMLITENDTNISLRLYDDDNDTFDEPVHLITESNNITAIEVVRQSQTSETNDETVHFLYSTSDVDLSTENPAHGDNNYRVASFNMSDFLEETNVSISGLTSNRLTWAGSAGETVWSNSSGTGNETLNISISPSTDILQVDVGFGASNNSNVSTANMTLYASTSETGTYHSMGTFPDGGGNVSMNTRDTWTSDPFPVSSQDYIYCRLRVDIPPDASASTSGNITDCKVHIYG